MRSGRGCVTFGGAGARRAGRARLGFGGHGFDLGRAGRARFLRGQEAGGGLPLFAKLKFPFCWWLRGNKEYGTR